MEKIGKKWNNILGQEQELRLEAMHKNSSIELKRNMEETLSNSWIPKWMDLNLRNQQEWE